MGPARLEHVRLGRHTPIGQARLQRRVESGGRAACVTATAKQRGRAGGAGPRTAAAPGVTLSAARRAATKVAGPWSPGNVTTACEPPVPVDPDPAAPGPAPAEPEAEGVAAGPAGAETAVPLVG